MKSIKQIEDEFNIKVIPARITGKRWTCIGKSFSNITPSCSNRIQVNSDKGFIVYNWDSVSNDLKDEVTKYLIELGDNEY